jgi:hypothetical protein
MATSASVRATFQIAASAIEPEKYPEAPPLLTLVPIVVVSRVARVSEVVSVPLLPPFK